VNSSKKGAQTALRGISKFIEKGIIVSIPFVDSGGYDFIADVNTNLIRIQSKTAHLRKGCLIFKTYSETYCSDKKGRLAKNYRGKIDYFYVHCGEFNEDYLVPVEDVPTSEGRLRLDEPSRSIKYPSIRWAKDYLFKDMLEKIMGS